MQLVIKIDEDTYRYMQSRCKYQNKGDKGLSKFEEVSVAIKNGTPLPKGHGRLIDADRLELDYDWSEYETNIGQIIVNGYQAYSSTQIESAPTIIEADTESEEKA